jgi:hypothetical protein
MEPWVEIRLLHIEGINLKALANGLCFYYSLRKFGILDPRSRLVDFLNDPENSTEVEWWLSISQRQKDNIVEILQMSPELDEEQIFRCKIKNNPLFKAKDPKANVPY